MLHPGTKQPVGPADLEPLFPMALILQEVSAERTIDIPEPIRDVYRMWRPSPLIRARRLEQALDTPAKIYFKYEGVSPAGSHKPNTAVPQAFYNKEAGRHAALDRDRRRPVGLGARVRRRAVRPRGQGLQVRVSYDQKPYRRALMETYGARCIASPSTARPIPAAPSSPRTRTARARSASPSPRRSRSRPRTPTPNTRSARVLNHVLLHQTVIGQEAIEQMEMAGDDPDIVIGCTGGGSNFAGHRLSVPRPAAARRARSVRVIAVEPAACPSLTRGKYAYDFGDTAHLTPLVKMHTLGSTFIPPGFHAGGLRYHGMAPMVSHLKELGLIEARAYRQTDVLRGRRHASRARRASCRRRKPTTPCAAPSTRRCAASEEGKARDDPLQPLRPRPFRHAGLHRLLRRQAEGSRPTTKPTWPWRLPACRALPPDLRRSLP